MSKMLIVVIILSWVLVNTWATLIWVALDNSFISSWDEYLSLFIVSIIGLPTFLIVQVIYNKIIFPLIKKYRKKKT